VFTKVGDGLTLAFMQGNLNIMTHVGDGLTAALAIGDFNIITKVGNDELAVGLYGKANIVTHVSTEKSNTYTLVKGNLNVITKVGPMDGFTVTVSPMDGIVSDPVAPEDRILARGDLTANPMGVVNSVMDGMNTLVSSTYNDITSRRGGMLAGVAIGDTNIITHIGRGSTNLLVHGEANIITKVGNGRSIVLANGKLNVLTTVGDGDSIQAVKGEANIITKVGSGSSAVVAIGKANIVTKIGDGLHIGLMHGNLNIQTVVGDGMVIAAQNGKLNLNTRVGDGTNISVARGTANLNIQFGDGLGIYAAFGRGNVSIKIGNGDYYGASVKFGNTKDNIKTLLSELKGTAISMLASGAISRIINGDEGGTITGHGHTVPTSANPSSLTGANITQDEDSTSNVSANDFTQNATSTDENGNIEEYDENNDSNIDGQAQNQSQAATDAQNNANADADAAKSDVNDGQNKVESEKEKIDSFNSDIDNMNEAELESNATDIKDFIQTQLGSESSNYDNAHVSSVEISFTQNHKEIEINGNNLKKIDGDDWNAGAFSNESITGDGSVSTVVGETNTKRIIGFSTSDSTQKYDTVNYGLFLYTDGNLYVRENGVSAGVRETYISNDVLEVKREGDTISYVKNGVTFYTSEVKSSARLYVDTSLIHNNATLNEITLNSSNIDTASSSVTFTDKRNEVEVTGNNLRKINGDGWSSGAFSNESITKDGSVSTKVAETDKKRIIGLSTSDTSQSYSSVNYGLFLYTGGNLYVRENGVSAGVRETYVTNDILEVKREGDTISYVKNGIVFYISEVKSTETLYIDTALIHDNATLNDIQIHTKKDTNSFESSLITNNSDFSDITTSKYAKYSKSSDITFTDEHNEIEVTSNNLKKVDGNDWSSGAFSNESITKDGSVSTVVAETNTKRMIGFSTSDTNQKYSSVDYGLYLNSNGNIYAYENGVNKGNFGTYLRSDVVEVNRVDDTISFLKNGIVFYTSEVKSTEKLYVDTSLITDGATLNNIEINSSTIDISFTQEHKEIEVNGNNLKKVDGDDWSSGAFSNESITKDGSVSTKIAETNTKRMIGFSTSDTNQKYSSVNYGLYLNLTGKISVYENGEYIGTHGNYDTGDIIEVKREGDTISYFKNDILLYISSVKSTEKLYVDTSLITDGATLNDITIYVPVISSFSYRDDFTSMNDNINAHLDTYGEQAEDALLKAQDESIRPDINKQLDDAEDAENEANENEVKAQNDASSSQTDVSDAQTNANHSQTQAQNAQTDAENRVNSATNGDADNTSSNSTINTDTTPTGGFESEFSDRSTESTSTSSIELTPDQEQIKEELEAAMAALRVDHYNSEKSDAVNSLIEKYGKVTAFVSMISEFRKEIAALTSTTSTETSADQTLTTRYAIANLPGKGMPMDVSGGSLTDYAAAIANNNVKISSYETEQIAANTALENAETNRNEAKIAIDNLLLNEPNLSEQEEAAQNALREVQDAITVQLNTVAEKVALIENRETDTLKALRVAETAAIDAYRASTMAGINNEFTVQTDKFLAANHDISIAQGNLAFINAQMAEVYKEIETLESLKEVEIERVAQENAEVQLEQDKRAHETTLADVLAELSQKQEAREILAQEQIASEEDGRLSLLREKVTEASGILDDATNTRIARENSVEESSSEGDSAELTSLKEEEAISLSELEQLVEEVTETESIYEDTISELDQKNEVLEQEAETTRDSLDETNVQLEETIKNKNDLELKKKIIASEKKLKTIDFKNMFNNTLYDEIRMENGKAVKLHDGLPMYLDKVLQNQDPKNKLSVYELDEATQTYIEIPETLPTGTTALPSDTNYIRVIREGSSGNYTYSTVNIDTNNDVTGINQTIGDTNNSLYLAIDAEVNPSNYQTNNGNLEAISSVNSKQAVMDLRNETAIVVDSTYYKMAENILDEMKNGDLSLSYSDQIFASIKSTLVQQGISYGIGRLIKYSLDSTGVMPAWATTMIYKLVTTVIHSYLSEFILPNEAFKPKGVNSIVQQDGSSNTFAEAGLAMTAYATFCGLNNAMWTASYAAGADGTGVLAGSHEASALKSGYAYNQFVMGELFAGMGIAAYKTYLTKKGLVFKISDGDINKAVEKAFSSGQALGKDIIKDEIKKGTLSRFINAFDPRGNGSLAGFKKRFFNRASSQIAAHLADGFITDVFIKTEGNDNKFDGSESGLYDAQVELAEGNKLLADNTPLSIAEEQKITTANNELIGQNGIEGALDAATREDGEYATAEGEHEAADNAASTAETAYNNAQTAYTNSETAYNTAVNNLVADPSNQSLIDAKNTAEIDRDNALSTFNSADTARILADDTVIREKEELAAALSEKDAAALKVTDLNKIVSDATNAKAGYDNLISEGTTKVNHATPLLGVLANGYDREKASFANGLGSTIFNFVHVGVGRLQKYAVDGSFKKVITAFLPKNGYDDAAFRDSLSHTLVALDKINKNASLNYGDIEAIKMMSVGLQLESLTGTSTFTYDVNSKLKNSSNTTTPTTQAEAESLTNEIKTKFEALTAAITDSEKDLSDHTKALALQTSLQEVKSSIEMVKNLRTGSADNSAFENSIKMLEIMEKASVRDFDKTTITSPYNKNSEVIFDKDIVDASRLPDTTINGKVKENYLVIQKVYLNSDGKRVIVTPHINAPAGSNIITLRQYENNVFTQIRRGAEREYTKNGNEYFIGKQDTSKTAKENLTEVLSKGFKMTVPDSYITKILDKNSVISISGTPINMDPAEVRRKYFEEPVKFRGVTIFDKPISLRHLYSTVDFDTADVSQWQDFTPEQKAELTRSAAEDNKTPMSNHEHQIIVITEGEDIVRDSAYRLASKHPGQTTIISMDKDGNTQHIYGVPVGDLNNQTLRISAVGHGRESNGVKTLGGRTSSEFATQISALKSTLDNSNSIARVSIMGCNIGEGHERLSETAYGKNLITSLKDSGLTTTVSVRNAYVKIAEDGKTLTSVSGEEGSYLSKADSAKTIYSIDGNGQVVSGVLAVDGNVYYANDIDNPDKLKLGLEDSNRLVSQERGDIEDVDLNKVGDSLANNDINPNNPTGTADKVIDSAKLDAIADKINTIGNTDVSKRPKKQNFAKNMADSLITRKPTLKKLSSVGANIQINVGDGEHTSLYYGSNNIDIKIGDGGHKTAMFGSNNALISIGDRGDTTVTATSGGYTAFEGTEILIGQRNLAYNEGERNDFIVMLDKSIPIIPFMNPFDGASGISATLKTMADSNADEREALWTFDKAKEFTTNMSVLDISSTVEYTTLLDVGSANDVSDRGIKYDTEATLNEAISGGGSTPKVTGTLKEKMIGKVTNFKNGVINTSMNFTVAGEGSDIILANGNFSFVFADTITSVLDTTVASFFGIMQQGFSSTGAPTNTFTFSPKDLKRQLGNSIKNKMAAMTDDITIGDLLGYGYTSDGTIYSITGESLDIKGMIKDFFTTIFPESYGAMIDTLTNTDKLLNTVKAMSGVGVDMVMNSLGALGLPVNNKKSKVEKNGKYYVINSVGKVTLTQEGVDFVNEGGQLDSFNIKVSTADGKTRTVLVNPNEIKNKLSLTISLNENVQAGETTTSTIVATATGIDTTGISMVYNLDDESLDLYNIVESKGDITLTEKGVDLVNAGEDLPSFSVSVHSLSTGNENSIEITPNKTKRKVSLNLTLGESIKEGEATTSTIIATTTATDIKGGELTYDLGDNISEVYNINRTTGEVRLTQAGVDVVNEGENLPVVMVIATSSSGNTNSQILTPSNITKKVSLEITVGNDLLEGMTIAEMQAINIAINEATVSTSTIISKSTATDTSRNSAEDEEEKFTYSIDDTMHYVINENTGTVTLNFAGVQSVNLGEDLPDFTITATSVLGNTNSKGVNPLDTLKNLAVTTMIEENLEKGEITTSTGIARIITSDITEAAVTDLNDFTYSIEYIGEEQDLSHYIINEVTGEVSLTLEAVRIVNAGGDLDAFNVYASSSNGNTNSALISPDNTKNKVSLTLSLGENVKEGKITTSTIIATSTATDTDGGDITYSLKDNSEMYIIDKSTGTVTLTPVGVDFINEGKDLHSFEVIANSSNGNTNSADISPFKTIHKVSLSLTLGENVKEGETTTSTIIATSVAEDEEIGDITYSIDDTTNYVINENTGTVTLSSDGVRSVNAGRDLASFTVTASSSSESKNSEVLTPIATINKVGIILTLAENVKEGHITTSTIIATSTATDTDGGELTYRLVSSGSDLPAKEDIVYYIIDKNTGNVTLTAQGVNMVNNGGDLADFNVYANSSSGNTNSALLSPLNTKNKVSVELTLGENVKKGEVDISTIIVTSTATDTEGGDITYSLDENSLDMYTINENTGDVTLRQAGIDYVNTGKTLPSFTVQANSSNGNTNSALISPLKTINKVSLTLTLSEDVKEGEATTSTIIATSIATDEDVGDITYFLSDISSINYAINESTGEVTLTQEGVDRVNEGADLLLFKVIASSSSGNTNSALIAPRNTINKVNLELSLGEDLKEGAVDSSSIIAKSTATDTEGGDITYSLYNSSTAYIIDESTGDVTLTEIGIELVNAGGNLPSFNVLASSSNGNINSEILYPNDTINKVSLTLSLGEDLEEGLVTTSTIIARSVGADYSDDGDITYSLEDSSNESNSSSNDEIVYYIIDENTGEVTLTQEGAEAVNAGKDLPEFTVEVFSSNGNINSRVITPSKTNNKVSLNFTLGGRLVEDSVNTSTIIARLSAADINGGSMTYSLYAPEQEMSGKAFGFSGLKMPSFFDLLKIPAMLTKLPTLIADLGKSLSDDASNMEDQMLTFFTETGYMKDDGDLVVSMGSQNFVWGGHGKDLIALLGVNNNVWAGEGDDVGYLMGEGNTFSGNTGNDTAIMMGQNHMFIGGEGDDMVVASGRYNNLFGGDGNDQLWAFGTKGLIKGGAGDDYIVSTGNNHDINAGEGDDFAVIMGSGHKAHLGEGNDQAKIFGNQNHLIGGAGEDIIDMYTYNSIVETNEDNDTVMARSTSQNNKVYTGSGNDTIFMGGLHNEYSAGEGEDIFVMTAQNIEGTITDISSEDIIVFNNFSYENLWFEHQNNDLIIHTYNGVVSENIGEDSQDWFEEFGAITVDDYFESDEKRAAIVTSVKTNAAGDIVKYEYLDNNTFDKLIEIMASSDKTIGSDGFMTGISDEFRSDVNATWSQKKDTISVII